TPVVVPMPGGGILGGIDAQLVHRPAHCFRLSLLKLADAVEEDFRIEVTWPVGRTTVMFVRRQQQLALAAFYLVSHCHSVAAGPPVDCRCVGVKKIGPQEAGGVSEECPDHFEPFVRKLRSQPLWNRAVQSILAGNRSLKHRVDIDNEMSRRIDEAVFRCEKGTVDATEGVLAFVDQVDSLPLLLKIANSPFGASMPFAGTAAEFDHINPCVEAAKTVPQLRLELLDAVKRCRTE